MSDNFWKNNPITLISSIFLFPLHYLYLLGDLHERCTLLDEAVCFGRIETVRVILSSTYIKYFSFSNKYGRKLLHKASANGHKEIAEYLISSGSDVNAKDNFGDTPLHYAVSKGKEWFYPDFIHEKPNQSCPGSAHRDIAELLISKGANVNAKNSITGNTPLHDAIFYSHKYTYIDYSDIIALLLEHGADRSIKNKRGYQP